MRSSLVACVVVAACSSNNPAYHCESDADCDAALNGVCQGLTKLCTYPNSFSFSSGMAYVSNSGDASDTCVQPPTPGQPIGDGGVTTDDAFVPQPDATPEADQICVGNDMVLRVCVKKQQDDRTFHNTLLVHGVFGNNSICDFELHPTGFPDLCVVQGHNITI